MGCIGPLPYSSNGHQYALAFIYLLMSYLVKVPLKAKSADEVSMVYIKEILPEMSCPNLFCRIMVQSSKINN